MAIIGKVSIKVWPDTKAFASATKAQLEKRKMPIVKIPVQPRFGAFKHHLKAGIEKQNAEILANKQFRIRVPVDIDRHSLREAAIEAMHAFEDGEIRVKTTAVITKVINGLKNTPVIDVIAHAKSIDQESLDNAVGKINSKREKQILRNHEILNDLMEDIDGHVDRVWNTERHRLATVSNLRQEYDKLRRSHVYEIGGLRSVAKYQERLGRATMSREERAWMRLTGGVRAYASALGDLGRSFGKEMAQVSFDRIAERDRAVAMRREIIATDKVNEALTRMNELREQSIDSVKMQRRLVAQAAREYDQFVKSRYSENFMYQARGGMKEVDRLKEAWDREIRNLTVSAKLEKNTQRDLQRQMRKLRLEAGVEVNMAGKLATQARLRAMALKQYFVDFVPRVSKKGAAQVVAAFAALSGATTGLDVMRRLVEPLKNLPKTIPDVVVLTGAIATLSSYLIVGAANAFSLVRSIAQIGPAVLLLPGLFAGMAFGMIGFVRAMQDFNDNVPQAAAGIKRIGDALSENFWAKASADINSFVNAALPVFEDGMSRVGTALGVWSGAVSRAFEDFVLPSVPKMFDGLEESILIFTEAAPAIGRLTRDLGTLGASYMPNLAEWAKRTANNWADFIEEATETGEIFEWIDLALDNLGHLGSSIIDLGRIIGGFGRASEAAGGATLETFAAEAERIANVVNGPAFQRGLTDFFRSARNGAEAFSAQFEGSSRAVDGLLDILREALPAMGEGFGILASGLFNIFADEGFQSGAIRMAEGFRDALRNIKPALEQLGPGLGSLLGGLGDVARNLSPIINTLIAAEGLILEKIMPNIVDASEDLTKALEPLIRQALPVVQGMVVELTGGIADLASKVREYTTTHGPEFTEVFRTLSDTLPNAIDNLLGVVEGVVDLAEGLGKIDPDAIKQAGRQVENLTQAVDGLFQVFNGQEGGFSTLFDGLNQFSIQGQLGKVRELADTWAMFFDAIGLDGPARKMREVSDFIGQQADRVGKGVEGVANSIQLSTGRIEKDLSDIIPTLSNATSLAIAHLEEAAKIPSIDAGIEVSVNIGVDQAIKDQEKLFRLTRSGVAGVEEVWRDYHETNLTDQQRNLRAAGKLSEDYTNQVAQQYSHLVGELKIYGIEAGVGFASAIAMGLSGGSGESRNMFGGMGREAVNGMLELGLAISTGAMAAADMAAEGAAKIVSNLSIGLSPAAGLAAAQMNAVGPAVSGGLAGARANAAASGAQIALNVRAGTAPTAGLVYAAMTPTSSAVMNGLAGARASALSSGLQTGLNVVSGARSGVAGLSAAFAATGAAIAAGLGAAKVTAYAEGVSIANAIKAGASGVSLYSNGQAIMNSLIAGIRSMIPQLRSSLQGVTALIPRTKGPMSVDRKLLTPNGEAIMGGLLVGLVDGWTEVRKFLQGATTELGRTQFQVPEVTARVNNALAPASSAQQNDRDGIDGATLYLDPTAFVALWEHQDRSSALSARVGLKGV